MDITQGITIELLGGVKTIDEKFEKEQKIIDNNRQCKLKYIDNRTKIIE